LLPAVAQQVATLPAKRCNHIIFQGRLEVTPNTVPEHPGRLTSGTELECQAG